MSSSSVSYNKELKMRSYDRLQKELLKYFEQQHHLKNKEGPKQHTAHKKNTIQDVL